MGTDYGDKEGGRNKNSIHIENLEFDRRRRVYNIETRVNGNCVKERGREADFLFAIPQLHQIIRYSKYNTLV